METHTGALHHKVDAAVAQIIVVGGEHGAVEDVLQGTHMAGKKCQDLFLGSFIRLGK